MTVIVTTHPSDSVKMLIETLSAAQAAILQGDTRARKTTHSERLGRLIADLERQRPTGADGKHGNLHTPTCGCEDIPALTFKEKIKKYANEGHFAIQWKDGTWGCKVCSWTHADWDRIDRPYVDADHIRFIEERS